MNAAPKKTEGFICPECKNSYESTFALQDHFINQHQNIVKENQSQLDSNKSFLQKVKTLNKSSTLSSTSNTQHDYNANIYQTNPSNLPKITDLSKFTTSGGIDEKLYTKQTIGETLNHTVLFKKTRHDYVASTTVKENRLILRLEKLLRVIDISTNKERRNYELTVADWANDSDVPLCPSCSKKFSAFLLRFPHHCRLCGCIMCEDCCLELSYQNAVKILKQCKVPSAMKINKFKLENAEYNYKVCGYCLDTINNKFIAALSEESSDEEIKILYEDLKDCIEAFAVICPRYTELVSQLHQGMLSLDHIIPANNDLTKLTKILSAVANICEKLKGMKVKRNCEARLKQQIRVFGLRFYEEHRQLPTPPTTKKYLQRQRDRIMKEKMRRLKSKKVRMNNSKNSKNSVHSKNAMNADRNLDVFVPKVSAGIAHELRSQTESSNVDPIAEQIRYVRNMLMEAEEQGRTEEVKLLQENLVALEAALEVKSQEDGGVNGSRDDGLRSENESVSSCIQENPFQAQMEYIEQLINEKRKKGDIDEVGILEQHLKELKVQVDTVNSQLNSQINSRCTSPKSSNLSRVVSRQELNREAESYPSNKNPFE